MNKYFYFSPFNGTITDIYLEPGTVINPGSQIAKIAKTGNYEVKVPINLDILEDFKEKNEAHFYTSNNHLIGHGKIIRISDVINQQTQSIDVYFSITPVKGEKLYNGIFVNVIINKKIANNSFIVPLTAVKNNSVNILDGSKVQQKKVSIVGSKPVLFIYQD